MKNVRAPASIVTRRSLLLAGAAWPWSAWSRPAAPDVPLAREAAPDIDPAGWLVSEKYDGVRALWDGTALRFRSGLPVAAPRWFVDRLPAEALDGELWLGRGRFEALAAAVRRRRPDDAEWRNVRYMVFDLPRGEGDFAARAARIAAIVHRSGWPQLVAVSQDRVEGRPALHRRLEEVVAGGGEGLVLHRADARWAAGRQDALLKLKPVADADARVIGYVAGQGRLAGRLGALKVRDDAGHEFLIGSGLSDAQRDHPPPLGSVVTFTYRGRTGAGVPRFATFWRERTI